MMPKLLPTFREQLTMKNPVKISNQIVEAQKPGIGRGSFVTLNSVAVKAYHCLAWPGMFEFRGAAYYWR